MHQKTYQTESEPPKSHKTTEQYDKYRRETKKQTTKQKMPKEHDNLRLYRFENDGFHAADEKKEIDNAKTANDAFQNAAEIVEQRIHAKSNGINEFNNLALEIEADDADDDDVGDENRVDKQVEKKRGSTKECTSVDGSDLPLIWSRFHITPKQNFCKEFQGLRNVQVLLEKAIIMLDNTRNCIELVVEDVLEEVLALSSQNNNETIETQKNEHSIEAAVESLDNVPTEKQKKLDTIQKLKQEILVNIPHDIDAYYKFQKTMHGWSKDENEMPLVDLTWLCAMSSLSAVKSRQVAIIRFKNTMNLGGIHSNVRLLILVLTPIKEKKTKDDVETARTFATLMSDHAVRDSLLYSAHSRQDIVDTLHHSAQQQVSTGHRTRNLSIGVAGYMKELFRYNRKGVLCNGIMNDVKNRIPLCASDYKDAFRSSADLLKTFTTILFLFFANLMPTIAFGTLNDKNTKGLITVQKAILGQAIGGCLYSVLSGQPLTIVLTTAPLAIIIKVVYEIAEVNQTDFAVLYFWISVFNCLYIVLAGVFDLSRFMRWSTRSSEEIFGTFITIAFTVDAIKACTASFNDFYYRGQCANSTMHNENDIQAAAMQCTQSESVLFLLLMLATLVLGLWMFNFTKTPFLSQSKRQVFSDFSLPIAIIIMSFFGSYVFRAVPSHPFPAKSWQNLTLSVPRLASHSVNPASYGIAAGLAIPLALLFFMDHNISGCLVNSPSNRLRKPASYHWDLVVVGSINLLLALFGLPWIHGALPHSPMHVKALAKREQSVDSSGHMSQNIVSVTESRVSQLVANLLIGMCLFAMPIPLQLIPVSVLNGLFLYMALTGLSGNQLFERVLLFFTQKSAYPPNHYIRRVPSKKLSVFTLLQVVQLGVLCVFGFYPLPYIKMVFPVILILLMPIRHSLLPQILDPMYLDALDKPI